MSYYKAFFRHSDHKNKNLVENLRVEYVYIYNYLYIYIYILFIYIYIYPKKLQFEAYGQFVLV